MNTDELTQKIDALTVKVDEIQVKVHKLYTYMKWTAIITIALFVLPLIGLFFAIPSFLSQLSTVGGF